MEPVDFLRPSMMTVICKLIVYEEKDCHAACNAERQAENIHGAVGSVPQKVSNGSEEMISQHRIIDSISAGRCKAAGRTLRYECRASAYLTGGCKSPRER